MNVCGCADKLRRYMDVPGYHQRATTGGSSQTDCGEAKGKLAEVEK